MAIAVLERKAGIAQFVDSKVRERKVVELMKRVTLVVDDELEALGYDQVRSRIRIKLKSGKIIEGRYDVARGHPEKPMSWAELGDKFRDCAGLVLPQKNVEDAIQLVGRLEELKSLRPLLRVLAGGKDKAKQKVKVTKSGSSKSGAVLASDSEISLGTEARGCVPPAVVDKAKLVFLDTLGIALASSTMDFGRMVSNVAQKLGGAAASRLIGSPVKVAAANAVLANGTLAHGLDYDDTLEAAIVHTGCCAGMTALAVGGEDRCKRQGRLGSGHRRHRSDVQGGPRSAGEVSCAGFSSDGALFDFRRGGRGGKTLRTRALLNGLTPSVCAAAKARALSNISPTGPGPNGCIRAGPLTAE